MAYIRTIPPEEATEELKEEYEAAVRRAGRVFNIVRLQSLNPRALALPSTSIRHSCSAQAAFHARCAKCWPRWWRGS